MMRELDIKEGVDWQFLQPSIMCPDCGYWFWILLTKSAEVTWAIGIEKMKKRKDKKSA